MLWCSTADLNKDVKNNEVYDVVAELQHSLQWPTVSEIDRTGIFVPPVRLMWRQWGAFVDVLFLKGLEHLLEQKSCLNFLANGDRKIVYSKALSLRGTVYCLHLVNCVAMPTQPSAPQIQVVEWTYFCFCLMIFCLWQSSTVKEGQ